MALCLISKDYSQCFIPLNTHIMMLRNPSMIRYGKMVILILPSNTPTTSNVPSITILDINQVSQRPCDNFILY